MLKKLFIILLCLTFTACSSGVKKNDGTPPDTELIPVAGTIPELTITCNTTDTESVYTSQDHIQVSNDSYIELNTALENWQSEYLDYSETIQWLEETAQESYTNLYLRSELKPARVDNMVLSLFESCNINSGGAHPNTVYNSVTFDVSSGDILQLEDIVYDYEDFKESASEYIIEYLENSIYADGMWEDYTDIVSEFDEEVFNWTLSAYGINFYYEAYTLGSYAMGPVHIYLPFSEFEDCMKPEYFNISSNCIVSGFDVLFQQNIYLPYNDDIIEFESETISEYEHRISCGNDSEIISCSYYLSDNYFFYNNSWYAAITIDTASADYKTLIYKLDNNSLELTDDIDAYFIEGIISFNSTSLASHVNILGTYNMTKNYYIDESGQLHTDDELYTIVLDNFVKELKNTVELPVTIEGQETTLPVGSSLYVYQTDGESVVYLYVSDLDAVAELKVEKSEDGYSYTVNGISEYDCFETLPYSG